MYSKLILAFAVGAIGSAAYITALYFKFIGETDDHRRIIMMPFQNLEGMLDGTTIRKMSVSKCFWYCVVGGCIAVIFQFDVPNFVAVQSLILGATWPAIVSQFLSGRMASPTSSELDLLRRASSPLSVGTSSLAERIRKIKEQSKHDNQ